MMAPRLHSLLASAMLLAGASLPSWAADFSLSFNGVSGAGGNYVAVPDNPLLEPASFTVEALVFSTAAQNDLAPSIYNKDSPSGFSLDARGSNVRVNIGGVFDLASSSIALPQNRWVHVAALYDSAAQEVRMYFDGVLVANVGSVAPPAYGANALNIGRRPDSGPPSLAGGLDEVRLWNIARTTAAIQADMRASLTGAEANLVGLWKFDAGTGVAAADSTPNGLNGTLVNSPQWNSAQPRGITDLQVSAVSTGIGASSQTVTLSWTAPGDNGDFGILNGSTFSVRWATFPINGAAAYSIAPFSLDIATYGVVPGSRQTLVFVLDPATTRYFVIKTTDAFGHTAALSIGATAQAYALSIAGSAGNSRGVAWGDYDNDGDLDAIVANAGVEDEFLLRNDGGGAFTKVALAGTAGSSIGVAWGDYDNDGDLDAIVANGGSADEFLLRNDGGGTFTKVTLTGTAGDSTGVAWGDYDNDGDLDALVANTTGEDEFLLRNDGGGAFTKVKLTGTGGSSIGVSWGDYDDDGDLDGIVANINGADEVLLRNDILVSHSSPTAPTGGFVSSFAEYSVSSASGVLTLQWGNASDAETSTAALRYFSRVGTAGPGSSTTYKIPPRYSLDGYCGGGSFLYSTKLSSAQRGMGLVMQKGATVYWAVVAADSEFQRSAESAEQSVSLVAPRAITDLSVLSIVSTGLAASSMTVTLTWTAPGDDGDTGVLAGTYDIRWATFAPANIAAYVLAPFSQLIATTAVAPGARQSVLIPFLNTATTLYFALTTKDAVGVRSDLSNAATAQAYITAYSNAGGSGRGLAAGDIDGDGDLDILHSRSNGGLHPWRNDGAFAFTDTGQVAGTLNDAQAVSVADMERDGDLDVLVANLTGRDEQVLSNDGAGSFTLAASTGLAVTYGVAWGDFDNDGRPDFAATNYPGDEYVAHNNGDGTFSTTTLLGTAGNSLAAAWADADQDGDLDLAIANDSAQNEVYVRNNGNGSFSTFTLTGTGGSSTALAWGDYDGDGDLDLAVGQTGGADETLIRNDGAGVFTVVAPNPFAGSAGNTTALAWADSDGDGDLDLLVANNGSPDVILRNDGGGAFTKLPLPAADGDTQGALWADLDGDGDLDVVLSSNSLTSLSILRNDISVATAAPSTPSAGFAASWSEDSLLSSSGTLTLQWTASTDNTTPAADLLYWVRVGTNSGGAEYLRIPPANSERGRSRIFSDRISVGQPGIRLSSVPKGGIVYWAAAAEDAGYIRSSLSAQQTADLTPPAAVALAAAQDATVETSSVSWIALTFNAPGEDGAVGDLSAGAVYDVRWTSSGAINSLAKYAAAAYQQSISAVGTAGAAATIRLAVAPGKTWHFALTTKDSLGSRSSLSNAVSAFAPVVLERVDEAGSFSILQGQTTSFLRLKLWTEGAATTADLLKVSVRKFGTLPDAAISKVALYLDDGNGLFDAPDLFAQQTSPIVFVSSLATLTLPAPLQITNSTQTFFVAVVVRPDFLPVPGASVSVRLEGEAIALRGAGVEQVDFPALSLDGIDDRATAAYSAALDVGIGGQVALEAWLRSTDTARANASIITRGGPGNNGYRLWLGGGGCNLGVPSFFVGNSVLCANAGGSQLVVTDGRWHHVAAVYSNTTLSGQFFIDGVALSTGPMAGTLSDAASDLGVGGPNVNGGAYFIGQMDDVRISNFARYPGELPPLKRNSATGAAALYHFDSLSVDALAKDGSTNGIDAALQGQAAGYARSTGTAVGDVGDITFSTVASLLPSALFRNDQNIPAMRLQLWTTGDFVLLDQVVITATGSAAPASVNQLKLYLDDGNGLFSPTLDTALTVGQSFTAGRATFNLVAVGNSQPISPSTKTLFVAWNVSISATNNADIGVLIASTADLVLSGAVDSISPAAFPLASGTAPIVAAQSLLTSETSTGTWLNVSSVVFRGTFGSGNIDHFHWRWNQTPGTPVDGSEAPVWSAGKTTVTATADANDWYFHARAFDTGDEAGTQSDLGPFWLDRTIPVGSAFLSKNSTGGILGEAQFNDLAGGVTVQLSVQDPLSGLNLDGPAPYAPSSGTVSLWHLNEGSGNWADSGPSGNTLSASGTPGRGPGRFDTGLLLDGVAYAQRGAPAGLPTGNASRSIEAWVNPASTQGIQGVVSWGAGGCTNFNRFGLSGGRLWADLGCSSTATAAVLSTGTWHHIAFTFDGAVGRFYLDGVRVASQTFGAQATVAGTLYLGNTDAGQLFRGSIDEARVSALALSDTEVAALSVRGDPYYISYSTDAGRAWIVVSDTRPAAGVFVTRTGAHGTTASQTLLATGLSLVVSTSAQTGAQATNQVRFHIADTAGNVRTAGPFAVIVDTNAAVAMSTPSLPAPGTYVGTNPDFYWTAPSTSLVQGMGGKFFIQVSSADPAFSTTLISIATPAVVTDTTLSRVTGVYLSTFTLTAGATYYWRVRSQTSLGIDGPWGPVTGFVVDASSPSVSTFLVYNSTGGVFGESGPIDLLAGVTVQLTVADSVSGLGQAMMLSTAAGTVAFWRYSERDGGSPLDQAQGLVGTLQSARYGLTPFGAGLSLGGGEYMSAPNASFNFAPASTFTVSAWIRQAVVGDQVIAAVGAPQTPAGGNWVFWITNTGALRLTNASGGGTLSPAGLIQVGSWQYVTVVQRGTRARFFINGVLRHAQNWAGNSGPGTMGFSVGAGIRNTTVPEGFFNGELDEVKVLSYDADSAEVAADYARQVPGRFAVEYSTTAGQVWNVVSATFPAPGFPALTQTGADGSAGPETITVKNLSLAHSTTAAVGSAGTNLVRYLSADRRGNFTLAGPFTVIVDTVAAAAVSTPSLPSPGVFVSTGPDFAWGGPSTITAAGMGAAALFYLEVDDQADFLSPAINISIPIVAAGTATAFTQGAYLSTTTLAHSTTYYWRVRARDYLGIKSPALTISSFVTDFASPTASSFASLSSTGGLVGEAVGLQLALGVTVQLTIQDSGPSGLSLSVENEVAPYGVMYTTGGAQVPPTWNDGAWGQALDDPGQGAARSFAVFAGALYMGTNSGKVWRYDGLAWGLSTTIPGVPAVLSLKAFNGKLYAGVGAVGEVWQFDGAAWSLAVTFPGAVGVQSLESYNGRLHAGTSSGRVMQLEPSNGRWEELHVFATLTGVESLTAYNGRLFAGANPSIYVFDGSTWTVSGTPSASIMALKAYDGKLFAATKNSGKVLQFNQGVWVDSLDPAENETVALAVHGGRLYAASALPSNGRLYAYDTKSWVLVRTLPTAADKVVALAPFNGRLYAGLQPASGAAEVLVSTPLVVTLSGAEGATTPQTLSAFGLNLVSSLTGQTCPALGACTATNQVRFTVMDRGGRVGLGGPFAILVDTLLSQPTVYFPAPTRWVRETQPPFAWTEANVMPNHTVQVSTASNFSGVLAVNDLTANSPHTAAGSLANATTYYWRVQAQNANGVTSAFSEAASFAVDANAPSTSAYQHVDSTGGVLAESQFTNLAAGATFQVTLQDPHSGLNFAPLASAARLGAWSFEGTGTTDPDFSGGGRDGTLGATALRTALGYQGAGLLFPSGAAAVNVSTPTGTFWSGMTVMGWVKPNINSAGFQTLWATKNNQVYYTSAAGRVGYAVRGSGCSTATALSYPVGAWAHVAFVVDAGANENQLFVNGVLAVSCSGSAALQDTSLRFGIDGLSALGTADAFSGFIDEARWFSAALSAADVRREMEGAPFAVLYSTNAGASWSVAASTGPAGPRLVFTGVSGSVGAEALLGVGLPLRQSTNTTLCAQVSPCGATNQVLFYVPDRAGGVRAAGPFAVRVDTSVPSPTITSLTPLATDQMFVTSTGTDNSAGAGLRDFLFEASTSASFAAPLSSSGFIAQSTYTFTGLLDAATHYVRVWSRDQILNISTPSVAVATATFGTVFVTTTAAQPPSALQDAFVPMVTLRLATKPGSTSRFISLIARKSGTALDSEVDQLLLYSEADGNGVFSGGDTQQAATVLAQGVGLLSLPGSGLPLDVLVSTFHIVVKMNPGSITDRTVGIEISSTTSFSLQHPARAQGSFPIIAPPLLVTDGANILSIIPTSLAPAVVQAGTNDVSVLELIGTADTGTSIISSVTLTMTGTTPPSKIRSVNLWRDADPIDGLFDRNVDVRLTSDLDTFGAQTIATMSLTGFVDVSCRTVTISPRRYFVTVSLAGDAPQDTVFRIAVASTQAVTLQNLADSVAFSTSVITSPISVILNNTLTVTGKDETAAAFVQSDRFTVLRVTATVDVGTAQINRFTARLTGTGQASDIAAVEIWRDSTIDGQSLNSVLDTRVGSAPYSGGLAVVNITTQSVTAGTSAVFFLAYVIHPAAAPGVTLGLKLSAGDVRAGNSGTTVAGSFPIESSSRTVQATVNHMLVTNAIADISPGTLLQGQQHAAMLRLDVLSDRTDFSWLGLSVERLGTAPDSAVSAVDLYKDFDGDGLFDVAVDSRLTGGGDVFSASTATLTLIQVQTVSAATRTYFVTLSVAPGAASGKTLGVRISSTVSFNLLSPNTASAATAYPIQTGLVPVNQFQNTITVTTASVVPGIGAEPGSAQVPLMTLTLRTDVSNATWQSLRVDQAGTAADADISAVKLYYDFNDAGTFDSSNLGNYQLVTSTAQRFGSNGPASVVVLISTPQLLGTAPKRYFLVVDLSTAATPARTVVVRASTGAFFAVDAPNKVDPNASFTSQTLNINAPPVTMFVVGTDSATATIVQGTPNVPMLTLKAWTGSFSTRWTQMRVTRTGTGQDAHVPAVKLYRDADGNGLLSIAQDERLSTGVFSGGTVLLSFSTQTITTSTQTYFVTVDFKTTATAGDTLGVRIAAAGDLRVQSPDTVSTAGFPLQSTNAAIVATQAGLSVTGTNLAPGELKQGTTEQVLMSLSLATTQFALTWSALTVRSTGSAADADIKAVSLWYDANVNGVVDVGTDTKITSGLNAFLGGTAVLSFSSVQEIGTAQKRYLLTVDVAAFAQPNRTFAVVLASTASFSVSAPNFTVNSGFPMQSDANTTLRKLEEQLVTTPTDLVGSGVNQGANQALTRLAARASRNQVSWSALTIRQNGNLGAGEIDTVGVWRDLDGDGILGGADLLVGSATFSGSLAAVFFSSVQTVGVATQTYFLAVQPNINATVGADIRLSVQSADFVLGSPDSISTAGLPFNTGSAVVLDAKTPSQPVVTDDGTSSSDFEGLNFKWSSAVGTGTLAGAFYAIGTTPGGTNIRPWTALAASLTTVRATGFPLTQAATFYVSVKAQSSFGFDSPVGVSDGILLDFQIPSAPAPSVTSGAGALLVTWGTVPSGPSGILGYLIEYRTGASPQWINAKTGEKTGVKALSVAGIETGATRLLAVSSAALVTGNSFQAAGLPTGTLMVRVSAVTGSGVLSSASTAIQVQLGPLPKDGISDASLYPNPFDSRKGGASIHYALSGNATVSIKVYSVFGRVIREMNFTGVAGSNTVTWDGADDSGGKVAKGMYLMVLTSGGATVTLKVGVIH